MDIGVIGFASTRSQPCAEWTAMDDYGGLISDRTPLGAVRLPLPHTDARTVVSRITNLPWPVAAVFVTGLGSSESATVQRRVADHGGPLVITELDLITVTEVVDGVLAERARRLADVRLAPPSTPLYQCHRKFASSSVAVVELPLHHAGRRIRSAPGTADTSTGSGQTYSPSA